MNIGSSINVEKLGDHNYETWKVLMKSILVYNGLWNYANGGTERPKEDDNIADWNAKDERALALIMLNIQDNQLGYVNKAKTSFEAWKILENVHSSKGPAKKIMLYRQLFSMKKGRDQPMVDHLRNFQKNVDLIEEIGVTIPKELLSIMLLNTLSEEYENFCVALEARDELPEMDVLKTKLLEEDARRNSQSDDKDDVNLQNAFLLNEKEHNIPNKSRENTQKYRYNGNRQRQTQRFDGRCYSCGRKGHKSSQCRNKTKSRTREAAMTALPMEDILMGNEWCLDSGASAHMCSDKHKFFEWDDNRHTSIQTAGNQIVKAYGSGTVVLNLMERNSGVNKIKLKNVMYVPTLKYNLISVTKVTENGHLVLFNEQTAFIKEKSNCVIMKAHKKGKLYVVDTCEDVAMFANQYGANSLEKWHERFGHLNFKDLKNLENKNLIDGLRLNPINGDLKCVLCEKGKIIQLPYKTSDNNVNIVLDVVHSDTRICGPFNIDLFTANLAM